MTFPAYNEPFSDYDTRASCAQVGDVLKLEWAKRELIRYINEQEEDYDSIRPLCIGEFINAYNYLWHNRQWVSSSNGCLMIMKEMWLVIKEHIDFLIQNEVAPPEIQEITEQGVKPDAFSAG